MSERIETAIPTAPAVDAEAGSTLLRVVGRSLAEFLSRGNRFYPDPEAYGEALAQPGASFVTYEWRDALVGCIGSLEPELPLVHDVSRNAVLAGFADPRTSGLTAVPLHETSVKVAVLSPAAPVMARSLEELESVVVAGVDGLILEERGVRATLLPSVWEKVGSVQEFLEALWKKAGLRYGDFGPATVVRRYRTTEFLHDDVASLIRQSA